MSMVRFSDRRVPAISRLLVPAALIVWALFPAQPFAQTGLGDLDLGGTESKSTSPETPADPYGTEDDEAFRILRGSRDIAKLRAFLSLFPESIHAGKVGERINSLLTEGAAAERLAQCNGVRWQQVHDSCSVPELEDFVSECGDSTYLNRARNRLNGIELRIICATASVQIPATDPEPPEDFVVSPLDDLRYLKTASNIRAGPGTSHSRILTLPRGTKVTVTGIVDSNGWLRIKLRDGATGYVSGSLALSTAPESIAPDSGNSGSHVDNYDADEYNRRAWELYLQRRNTEALTEVDRSLSLEPDSWYAIDTRAHVLAALGRRQEALAAFKRVMRMSPDSVRMYQEALAKHGYYRGAIDGYYGPSVRAAMAACLDAGCRVVE